MSAIHIRETRELIHANPQLKCERCCRSGIIRCGVVALAIGCAFVCRDENAKAQSDPYASFEDKWEFKPAERKVRVTIAVQSVIGSAIKNAGPEYREVADAIYRFTYGDNAAARAFLEAAKTKWPKLPPSELMMAKMFMAAEQREEMLKELDKCVTNNPDDLEAYLMLGKQALDEHRLAIAEVLFDRAKLLTANFQQNSLRKRDFLIRTADGLAAVAEAREQWDVAEKHLRVWLAIVDPAPADDEKASRDPASAPAHVRLARVLFEADKTEFPDMKKAGGRAAYQEFQAALRADDSLISPDIAIAQLYEGAHMHHEAKQFVARGVETLQPGNVPSMLASLLAAAHWGLETDQPKEASQYADSALKIDPISFDAKFCRGLAFRYLKDVQKAEKDITEVFLASPGNFAASNQLAQVLAEQHDKDKHRRAIEIAEMNHELYGKGEKARKDPRQAIEACATLGWAYFVTGRRDDADRLVSAAIKMGFNTGNPNPDAYYYKARILVLHDKRAEARKFLKMSLELSKSFVHHQDAMDLLAELGTGAEEDDGPVAGQLINLGG